MDLQKLLLFFIDGLGLGADDPISNQMRGLFSGLMGEERFIGREAPFSLSEHRAYEAY